MTILVVSVVFGISTGMLFFLVATGFSIVMGLMDTVNLAHGSLFLLGAYLGITVGNATHNYVLGVVAGIGGAAVTGLILERAFLGRLYRRYLDQILITFGFIYIINNLHLWVYGPWPKGGLVPSVLSGSVGIGAIGFPIYRIFVIALGCVLFVSLWWLQDRTKIGAIVRAGMDDKEMVGSLGINLVPITVGAFVLSAALAGFAGVVGAGALGGVQLGSDMSMLNIALAVVIIGGMGSILGALCGSLLIGLLTSLAATYVPFLDTFVIYVAMVAVLLVRPQGMFGRRLI